ncbi:MAG: Na+/H+ antiporter subunit E [Phycisphaeraceae bacterium]|nr:MAG: Na+/H+ antiporter subunit E [Phycisphaeraceae bacterium]
MSAFMWNILLAFVWAVTTELFTPTNFVIGFIIGYIVLWFAPSVEGRRAYFLKSWRLVTFLFFFIKELVIANVRMAYYTISPLNRMKPGVIGIPLEDLTDSELVVLSNLITLTPGTLSVFLSQDRKTLYVHFMRVDDPDKLRSEIKGSFERRLLELTR